MSNHSSDVSAISQVLLQELKRCFKKYTNPSEPDYEKLFVTATALDPRYCYSLNAVQTESAKEQLLKEVHVACCRCMYIVKVLACLWNVETNIHSV